MRIIISPAKKMNIDIDSLPFEHLPPFLPETEILLSALQKMDYSQLKAMWRCNDTIAELNHKRIQTMDLHSGLTPAILSYEGIQFQYMAPSVFEEKQFDYINHHLRILSGFYGLLRPFDGVTPYRLEMQARLAVNEKKNLYAFWGNQLARRLCSETDFILNLASNEYSKAVLPHLPPGFSVLTCTFGEQKEDGKVIEKGTLCKIARGELVRWLAENAVTAPKDIQHFNGLGYTYQKELSTKNNFVFMKKEATKDAASW